jgi:hypothetical protein
MFDMWAKERYELVERLIGEGLSSRRISRLTGVPDSTVRNWRRQPPVVRRRARTEQTSWRPQDPEQYVYLLGQYLGDGHISKSRGHPFLRLYLDQQYRLVVQETVAALKATFPDANVRRYEQENCRLTILQVSDPALLLAFPQHGPGRKHTRRIELEAWQSEWTTADPRPLIRGLIHSDGCRCVNRFSVALPSGRTEQYEYVRYFFTNKSADIQRIFCDHCDLLGIRWTQSNHRNISISHRHSVRLLDSFVGPKG